MDDRPTTHSDAGFYEFRKDAITDMNKFADALAGEPEIAWLKAENAALRGHLNAIGNSAGYPEVADKAQLAATIIKRLVRLSDENAALRATVERSMKRQGQLFQRLGRYEVPPQPEV